MQICSAAGTLDPPSLNRVNDIRIEGSLDLVSGKFVNKQPRLVCNISKRLNV